MELWGRNAARLAEAQASQLRSMFVRFAQPAYPGETIRVEMFDEGDGRLRFRAFAVERSVLVLDRGECQLGEA